MRIALATLVSLLAATAAFAQDPPADPAAPPPTAEAPAADAAPTTAEAPPAAAQSDDQARAAERCRAARSTESRLRSSRRQRCPAALPQTDAAAPQPSVQTDEDDDPAQSPTQPPASQQPH